MSALQIPTAEVFLPFLVPSRYKGAYGGRGGGKSWFFADLLIERSYMQPGLRAVCIREYMKDLAHSSKRTIEDRIKTHDVVDDFRVLQSEIRPPGDGLIIFQGMQDMTAQSIRSLEGFDIAWVEEAQTLSERSLDTLRPTIRKDPSAADDYDGSELWFSWNPDDPKDAVDRFFRGKDPDTGNVIRPPSSTVVEVNWWDNPWFPDVLRQEMEYDKRRDPDKYAHIWLGQYRSRSDRRVFSNWRIDQFETPDDARLYFGADWGFAVDPTVLVRCWIRGHQLFVDYEAYQVGCQIENIPLLFNTVPGAKKWRIRADSARPDTIDFVRRRGFRITPSLKGKDSVMDGIEFLKSFDIVVHERCRRTIDELSTYSWKVDQKTDEVLPVLEDKDNHVIDSLRYALEDVRHAGRPFLLTPKQAEQFRMPTRTLYAPQQRDRFARVR